MGNIYKHAKEVLLWLGNYNIEDSLIFDHEVHYICRHDYWNRAWIAQEILLQSNITLLLGRGHLFWSTFRWHVMTRQKAYLANWPKSLAYGLVKAWEDRKYDPGIDFKPNFYFWYLLEKRSESKCSDTRDRLYSLLALTEFKSERGEFVVDYEEDVISLFWRAAQYYDAWCDAKHMAILLKMLDLSVSQVEASASRDSSQVITLSRAEALRIPCVESVIGRGTSDPEEQFSRQEIRVPLTYMIDHMRSMQVPAHQELLAAHESSFHEF